jgi:hypothetical protein
MGSGKSFPSQTIGIRSTPCDNWADRLFLISLNAHGVSRLLRYGCIQLRCFLCVRETKASYKPGRMGCYRTY